MFKEDSVYIVHMNDRQEPRLEDVPARICDTLDHTHVHKPVIATVEDMLYHLDLFEQSGVEEVLFLK